MLFELQREHMREHAVFPKPKPILLPILRILNELRKRIAKPKLDSI